MYFFTVDALEWNYSLFSRYFLCKQKKQSIAILMCFFKLAKLFLINFLRDCLYVFVSTTYCSQNVAWNLKVRKFWFKIKVCCVGL